MKKIEVGILGATGVVGQKLVALLANHPWFEIKELVASERSAGKNYGEYVSWRETTVLPEIAEKIQIKKVFDRLESKILFSSLDSCIAGEAEQYYRDFGHIIVSNSKNHRMAMDVPLIIPEVNGDHIDLIRKQQMKNKGFIITNPNCTVIIIALAIFPLFKTLGLKNLMLTTMQAISGAGYPGVAAVDITGNIIPYIADEEEKIATELLKIFGKYQHFEVKNANFRISAACNRVPVNDGHTVSVALDTVEKSDETTIIHLLSQFKGLDLPSSPPKVIKYFNNCTRPQPKLDIYLGNGMTISVSNLRRCEVLDWKLTALGHNTIRGAAGAAILNAEYLVANNLHI